MTRFCEEILGYLVELEDRIIRGLGIPGRNRNRLMFLNVDGNCFDARPYRGVRPN